jgi:hypothetical protein
MTCSLSSYGRRKPSKDSAQRSGGDSDRTVGNACRYLMKRLQICAISDDAGYVLQSYRRYVRNATSVTRLATVDKSKGDDRSVHCRRLERVRGRSTVEAVLEKRACQLVTRLGGFCSLRACYCTSSDWSVRRLNLCLVAGKIAERLRSLEAQTEPKCPTLFGRVRQSGSSSLNPQPTSHSPNPASTLANPQLSQIKPLHVICDVFASRVHDQLVQSGRAELVVLDWVDAGKGDSRPAGKTRRRDCQTRQHPRRCVRSRVGRKDNLGRGQLLVVSLLNLKRQVKGMRELGRTCSPSSPFLSRLQGLTLASHRPC